jgi:hypothetical protein
MLGFEVLLQWYKGEGSKTRYAPVLGFDILFQQ